MFVKVRTSCALVRTSVFLKPLVRGQIHICEISPSLYNTHIVLVVSLTGEFFHCCSGYHIVIITKPDRWRLRVCFLKNATAIFTIRQTIELKNIQTLMLCTHCRIKWLNSVLERKLRYCVCYNVCHTHNVA